MGIENAPCTTCGTTSSGEEMGTPHPLGGALFESRLAELLYRLAREQARPDETGQLKIAAGVEHKDGKKRLRIADAKNQNAIDAYKLDSFVVADNDKEFSLVSPSPPTTMPSDPQVGTTSNFSSTTIRLALGRLLDEV